MPLKFIFIVNSSAFVCEFERQRLHDMLHYLKPQSTHFRLSRTFVLTLIPFWFVTQSPKIWEISFCHNFPLSRLWIALILLLEMSLDFNQCSLHIAGIPSNYQQLHRTDVEKFLFFMQRDVSDSKCRLPLTSTKLWMGESWSEREIKSIERASREWRHDRRTSSDGGENVFVRAFGLFVGKKCFCQKEEIFL